MNEKPLRRAQRLSPLLAGVVAIALPVAAAAAVPRPTILPVAAPEGADGFGAAVAGLGDIDGDGISDLVVGAPGSGGTHVVSGATRAVLASIADPAGPGFDFGSAVSGVGDLDGDGVDDLAVGAPSGSAPAQGRVFLFSGATGALLRQLIPPTTDYLALGRSVVGAGDLSGDGVPDVVVGAPRLGHGRGAVFAFSGADGTQLWSRLEPSGAPERLASFGQLVVATPDVSGDGVVDLLVSAPLASSGGQPVSQGGNLIGDVLGGLLGLVFGPVSSGRVDVLSGASGEVVRNLPDPTPGGTDGFGAAIAAIGDQDGDGVGDHLVGEGGANQLHLYSGKDGGVIRSVATPPVAERPHALTLARVDDKDGDGRDDFWIGIPSARTAFLVNGTGTVLASAAGPSPLGSFGAAVGTAGNVGGDPGPDVVVGDPTGPGGGAAYVLHSGSNVAPVERAGTNRVAECSGTACGSLRNLRAQTPVPTTTTTTTTIVTSTTTTDPPATATLPKPAGDTAEASLPGTGGVDRLVAGLTAIGLGITGLSVVRRHRQPCLRREPPSTG